MNWYAAHIIMAVKLKEKPQKQFPVWENIVLIEADSEKEAFARAEQCGRASAGDDDGSFRWDGEPATWLFVGVRKMVECALMGSRPGDGDEMSYTELVCDSWETVQQLAQGESVSLRYNDRFAENRNRNTDKAVNHRKKKRA